MSDFFEQFEAQLRGAAQARVERDQGRAGTGRRFDRARRLVPLIAGVAVAAFVAVIALALLGHRHGGGASVSAGGSRAELQQEAKYIHDAVIRASTSDRACRTRPKILANSTGTPEPELLSILGVLRRPATPADRLPRAMQANSRGQGAYVHYIRLARVQNGISYYIEPVSSLSSGSSLTPRCLIAVAAALRKELPRIPAPLRAPTLARFSEQSREAKVRSNQANQPGICLLMNGPKVSGGTCGATASEIRSEGLLGFYGQVSGVVPDGVASVTLRYPASTGHSAETITANVVENIFATSRQSQLPLFRGHERPTVTWRSALGRVIRTVPANLASASGTSAFCGGSAC
jgi:hypothetical protein